MTVYVLMVGDYREEYPIAVYVDRGRAQAALDAAALAEACSDPFVVPFVLDEADGRTQEGLDVSPAVAEERARVRAEHAAAQTARIWAAIAAGEPVCSTSPFGATTSIDVEVTP